MNHTTRTILTHVIAIAAATALIALGDAAFAGPDSDQLAATMKRKLAESKGGTVQPTGIEVPGCTWYVNNDLGRGIRSYCAANDARDARLFFDVQDRNSGGSGANQ